MIIPLKLGIVDQTPVRNGGTAAEAIGQTLELARIAERLGYHRYWVAEHHSTNSFAGAAPEVLIPRIASITRELRVGAGGVMLSHYSPLKVAEQFRMLEALFPGRVDLGVGRAPGGDHRATQALGYGRHPIPIEEFPQQLADLAAWVTDTIPPDHGFRKVRAMPRVESFPELWVLGSGGSSAAYAAQVGAWYSFAQFISGVDGSQLAAEYRRSFQPSQLAAEPRVSVGIGVVCADTSAEAERLALSLQLWRGRIATGRDRGIPSPEQAEEEFAAAGIDTALFRDDARVIAGDPESVRTRLIDLARRYAADELMIVTVTHSHAARVRSYELVAEAMGLPARS